MKAICVKNYLKEAVYLCEKISGKNLTLPILNNILISTEDNILKITATNLELGIEIKIPAKIEKTGKLAIPANIISNFINSLTADDNIVLESQQNNLFISIPNSSTLIKGYNPEDFPILPKTKEEKKHEILIKDLILGLKSVWYAISFSNIKPEIASVFIYSGKNAPLTFVATDSFRLAEKKFNYSIQDLKGLLIPHKTAAEILRIFDGKEGKIKVNTDNNQLFILTENIKFISRLTEGIFPDYQQVVPQKFVSDVVVEKNDFINALKTANIFSGKLNELKIIVGLDNGSITLNTSSSEAGEHTTTIKAKVTGEELKMAFNSKYIFECLPHIFPPQIILRFSGEGKPLVISGLNDNSFHYLVMPMTNI
ncbi:MAG: DNA polymerase III subunit beta [Patescibacteria group bacterium]